MKNTIFLLIPLLLLSCATTAPYYSEPNGYTETAAEKAIEYPYSVWTSYCSRLCEVVFESADTLTVRMPNIGKTETERYRYYMESVLLAWNSRAADRDPLSGVHLQVSNLDEGWSGHIEMSTRGHGDFGVREIKDRNHWFIERTRDKTYIKKLVEKKEFDFSKSRIPEMLIYNNNEGKFHIHKFQRG